MNGFLLAVAVGCPQRDEMLRLDQVRGITHFAAEPHDHVRRHVGMMGKTREHALEDLMVESFKRQPAAPLVGDGEDAVDIGEIPPPGPIAEFVGDVARRAGRTIDRADHGDIVPRSRPGRPGADSRGKYVAGPAAWLGPFGREGIVTLEEVGFEVMHVDQRAGGDRLRCKADDLSVLAHRLAGFDVGRVRPCGPARSARELRSFARPVAT